MSDKISVSGVRVKGKHGYFEQEKLTEQEFIVDVVMELDLSEAGESDDLTKTVNYDDISELIYREITGPSVNLIETLAKKVGDSILKYSSLVDSVKVTVHKPAAPLSIPVGDVSVTLKIER